MTISLVDSSLQNKLKMLSEGKTNIALTTDLGKTENKTCLQPTLQVELKHVLLDKYIIHSYL